MPQQVSSGAVLQCTFGAAPSTLTVTPEKRIMAGSLPAATILDHIPMKNIMPFGMCSTLSNPVVAAATAAKLGAFTPGPCLPATTAPWTPGLPTVTIGGVPVLTNNCTLLCQWGGVITITNPGQLTVVAT